MTLRFSVGAGELPVCVRALCFRFCADGTLRSGDNAIAAHHEEGGWRFRQGLRRELECAGPVVLRARRTKASRATRYGPFKLVRTDSGLLIGDDASLGVCLPTWESVASDAWHEIALFPVAPTI